MALILPLVKRYDAAPAHDPVGSALLAPVPTGVTVSITGFSPRLPDARKPTQKITIGVRIVNTTPAPLNGVELELDRGSPLTSEASVNAAIAVPPAARDVNIPATKLVSPIAAGATRYETIKVILGAGGLCVGCGPEAGSVYPIDVSVRAGGSELARAHTLLPAFKAVPKPVDVSWIWPLIDRPHRGLNATVFTDDALASSVAKGGRLDRALRVVETVHRRVAVTLVIDPELVDALSVMTKGYTVRSGARTKPGTGQQAAAAWLHRLRVVLASTPAVLTSYADADIDALTRAGIDLPVTLDADVATRVRAALGRVPASTLVWPDDGELTSRSLDAVVSNGATSVLLNDDALPGALKLTATPDALSPLPAATGTATAVVLSTALQNTVDALTTAHPDPLNTQRLFAQLAVRAAHDPRTSHFVALAGDRYVDPDVAATAATMLTLAAAPWARTISVQSALDSITPVDRGVFHPAVGSAALSVEQTGTLSDVARRVSTLRECLDNDGARQLVGAYTLAQARGSSSWWRLDPAGGQAYVNALRGQIIKQEAGIRIESPANSTFTLASSDAPLYIAVENRLPVAVSFRLRAQPVNGEAGFRTDQVAVEKLNPGDRRGIKVGAHVDKSGSFQITVTLVSPAGTALSAPVPFRIHSTAYGRAALWITGTAFGVLLLALARRAVLRGLRYWRRRRRGPQLPRPTSYPVPQ